MDDQSKRLYTADDLRLSAFSYNDLSGIKTESRTGKTKKKKPSVPEEVRAALALLPPPLRAHARTVAVDPAMNNGIVAMLERVSEFPTPTAAVLSGIIMNPDARRYFDARMDEAWEAKQAPREVKELVIGGGPHAAIYCAVRVAMGHPKPLVIERNRVGGSFAVSREPSFFLNSRSRPGELSPPATPGALNVLPGAMLQPADLGGGEYQTNLALAWAVRASLAMQANVVIGTVKDAAYQGGKYRVTFTQDGDSKLLRADRVILATGLGDETLFAGQYMMDRALSFSELMARMDQPFPLRDMRRVAVIGAGDSGRTAIEALTGQGPNSGWSVATLDWPDEIDWYGCQQIDRETWEACNRSRYKGIGRLLPRKSDVVGMRSVFRVRPIASKANALSPGFNCVYVDGKPYDHVVVCTGYGASPLNLRCPDTYTLRGRNIAKWNGANAFKVGPAAGLSVTERELIVYGTGVNTNEGKSALYRWAPLTASLAACLD